MIKKIEAYETSDGKLFKDEAKADEYEIKNAIVINRNILWKTNKDLIKRHIFVNLKEDLRNKNIPLKEISCYFEDYGWECDGKDNPIDKCVYSHDLFYGDDGCVFCGNPEERK